jgi:hypothetical protein
MNTVTGRDFLLNELAVLIKVAIWGWGGSYLIYGAISLFADFHYIVAFIPLVIGLALFAVAFYYLKWVADDWKAFLDAKVEF